VEGFCRLAQASQTVSKAAYSLRVVLIESLVADELVCVNFSALYVPFVHSNERTLEQICLTLVGDAMVL